MAIRLDPIDASGERSVGVAYSLGRRYRNVDGNRGCGSCGTSTSLATWLEFTVEGRGLMVDLDRPRAGRARDCAAQVRIEPQVARRRSGEVAQPPGPRWSIRARVAALPRAVGSVERVVWGRRPCARTATAPVPAVVPVRIRHCGTDLFSRSVGPVKPLQSRAAAGRARTGSARVEHGRT